MRSSRLCVHALTVASLAVLYGCGGAYVRPGGGDVPDAPEGAPVCTAMADEPGTPTPIGPGGGTVRSKDHRLEIRPGSVPVGTAFTMRARSAKYVFVDIKPDGQKFDPPAKLTLSYSGCTGPSVDTGRLTIVRWNPSMRVWEKLPSRVDPDKRMVSAELEHLTGYAIAGN